MQGKEWSRKEYATHLFGCTMSLMREGMDKKWDFEW